MKLKGAARDRAPKISKKVLQSTIVQLYSTLLRGQDLQIEDLVIRDLNCNLQSATEHSKGVFQ